MALDDKDKVIAALAVGFLLVTTVVAMQAVFQFQRYGARPIVNLTEFRARFSALCDGNVDVSFLLTNTGRDGFAQIEVLADKVSLFTNNYRLGRGETRPIAESMFVGDCAPHTFSAEVTATWA